MLVLSFDLLPPFQEETNFLLATNQRCESSSHRNIETLSGSAFLEDAIHVDGFSHTSECLFAQVLAGKIALDQAIGRTTDHKSIGGCQSLNSRRDIGCLAQCQLFLASLPSHLSHNDKPSMDTHTKSQF